MSLNDDMITIETSINASSENVWDAWTDPSQLLKWFGSDPSGIGIKAGLDVRPGGSFRITFKDSDQTEHTCYGVYLDVDKFHRLSFTWTWKSEPGVESIVTIELFPEGGQTRMRFNHTNVGDASRHNYLNGWQATFLKLKRMLNQS